MKRLNLVSSVLMLFVVVLIASVHFSNWHPDKVIHKIPGIGDNTFSNLLAGAENQDYRENITFILGTDVSSKNPFYREAERFYRQDTEHGTEMVITDCLTLRAVRNYLSAHKPRNGKPYGIINLVSHGNRWQGLKVAVTSDYARTTNETIDDVFEKDNFPELPDEIVDDKSKIVLHACGLGDDAVLLKKIGVLFGGSKIRPAVIASRHFEYYYSEEEETPKHMHARASLAFYKTGYRPGDIRIARQLRNRYPKQESDWRSILRKESPRWSGDSYHYTFNVPVLRIFDYPHQDSVPDLGTKAKQSAWLQQQKDLIRKLEELGIPPDKFDWRFRKIRLIGDDGSFVPAIRVKGYCTVLCVIEPLIEEDKFGNINPIEPSLSDTSFYGIY